MSDAENNSPLSTENPRSSATETNIPTPEIKTFDVVVIGGGAVGENLADRAVQGGLSAVVIESQLVGGACSYWACMPSKALLRPGAALAAARAVPGAGTVPNRPDVEQTHAARDSFTSNWDDSSQVDWLEGAGIELLRGSAQIVGPREVEVLPGLEQSGLDNVPQEPIRVRARHAVAVCTGSEPALPPIPGLEQVRPWTSAEATATNEVPEDLLIVGGGVVACEMATVFADLGSRVHLLVRGERLLADLDDFVSDALTASLRDMGVDVRFNTEATSFAPVGADPADLIVDDAASVPGIRTKVALTDGSTVVADQVLIATGRHPNWPGLSGFDFAVTDSGAPAIDENLQVVGTDWLYAVGDVSNRAHTTHQGKYQARIIGDLIAARAAQHEIVLPPEAAQAPVEATADLSADKAGAPQVVFTRPEVAHVGLTSSQAAERGIQVQVYDQDLGAIAGAALHAKDYSGQVRFVVDVTRHVLVGATFVGQDVAEMLQAATIAIIGEVPLDRLWHVVPAYPTMSEVWLRFLERAGW